jgi:hypothetical protein
VELDDSRHDREAEARAARLGRIKGQEDLLAEGRIDTLAAVRDREEDLTVRAPALQPDGGSVTPALRRCRFHGIAQQVHERAAQKNFRSGHDGKGPVELD